MWKRQNDLHAASGSPYFARDPLAVASAKVGSVPMKRLGEQTELAELVSFLASGKCNFVNGQQIPFTGAWPGVPAWPVKL